MPEYLGANQLMNQVVDATGAPHTPWTALLNTVAQEVPAMERTAWVTTSGDVTSEGELSPEAQQALADYRMAQYDMTEGEGWGTQELLGFGD